MADSQDVVLVTGGSGFIGSNLVPRLIDEGYTVRVLDNLSCGRRQYLDGVDCEIFVGDIRDPASCRKAFDGVKLVIHLAAYGSVVESVTAPRENFEINVLGTFNILSLCVENGVDKLVFSSTGGALIGDAIPPVNEQSLPKPISPYGAGKLCGESYCHAFAKSFGLNTVCLRFANVYGQNSYHKTGVINKFFQAVKDKQPLVIYGDGTSSRDYIHVSDLADGIVLAATSDTIQNDVIHLAAGIEISLKELAEVVKSVSGNPDHRVDYRQRRTGEVDRNFASYDYANEVLGFSPRYSLHEGLKELWEQYEWS